LGIQDLSPSEDAVGSEPLLRDRNVLASNLGVNTDMILELARERVIHWCKGTSQLPVPRPLLDRQLQQRMKWKGFLELFAGLGRMAQAAMDL